MRCPPELKIWILIVLALPVLIEQICAYFPEDAYCQRVGPYICDPEPISTDNPGIITRSRVETVFNSTATITSSMALGQGTTTTTS